MSKQDVYWGWHRTTMNVRGNLLLNCRSDTPKVRVCVHACVCVWFNFLILTTYHNRSVGSMVELPRPNTYIIIHNYMYISAGRINPVILP